MSEIALNLDLYPKQHELLASPAQELFYGGAAGGGKSHVARIAATAWANEIPGLQIYYFRRFYDDLVSNHIEGPTGFRALLEPWVRAGWVHIVEGEIRFAWKSRIFLRHCQYERDLPRLLGPEIHVLFIEECGQFSENMIRFIRGRLRIPDTLKIPDKYRLPRHLQADPNSTEPEYSFPRAVYTSNPGGIGHAYLKRAFVVPSQKAKLWRAGDDDGGMLRQFIPAKLSDNPSIDRKRYEANLKGLGSPALVKSLLEGDWDAVVGAFFPEIQKATHLIKPFALPSYLTRFVSMDWGACGEGDPFAIGWWAVSDGSINAKTLGGDIIRIPVGGLICYRIWYGRGLPKVTARFVAKGILAREENDGPIVYRVAGGDIQEKRGHGPSIFEMLSDAGVIFTRADMRRVSGWQQIRERASNQDRPPAIVFFDECESAVETLINLQHDPRDPNDAMEGEDHVPDMVRYACMSRAWPSHQPAEEKTLEERFTEPTLEQLWERRSRLLRRRS